ncbi:choline ABC transporter permease, partial [Bacillus atrophaeus]|nr:choline ABC transporter permease [Bacillus atrophaeus]
MNQTVQFLQTNGGEMLYKTWEHLYISIIAVILGILVAVPLGIA